MRISGAKNCAFASSKFSFRTCATYSGSNRMGLLSLSKAHKISHQLVCTFGPGGQLAPQHQPDVDPAPLAVARFDQGAGLRTRVVRKGIGRPQQVDVARIAVGEKIRSALLHPSAPRL